MFLVRPPSTDLNWQGTSRHRFSLNVSFPVAFTANAWDPHSTAVVDALSHKESDRRHRVLIAIDENVLSALPGLPADIGRYFQRWQERLEQAGDLVVVRGGEATKNSLRTVSRLLRQMDTHGIDRHSFVLVIGGGAVLDAVSFAAALCHRGVRVVRMPSTVLAQCDSGIAVKNGVNLFGKKNFIGTFVPPFAVINDVSLLRTLGKRDLVSGLIEIVKVSLLRDPVLFGFIEEHRDELADPASDTLAYVVRRSAELHLEHICGSGDPFELGSARPLDFGHWAAHKLESLTHHRVRHGEAVAIGISLDLLYSVRMGIIGEAVALRILSLLESLGFTLWDEMLGAGPGRDALLSGLREFQEHLGGELHVTLLRDIGDPFEVTRIDAAMMMAALGDLGARAEARRAQTR